VIKTICFRRPKAARMEHPQLLLILPHIWWEKVLSLLREFKIFTLILAVFRFHRDQVSGK